MGGGSESKKQLGKILLQQKLVSPDVLQEMLDEQKRDPGSRLASAAARRGRVSVADALRALSEQHGVPAVDLADVVIPLATLRLIPIEMAHEHALLPFRVEGDQLLLAMSSPDRRDAIEEIEFVASKKVQIHVALDHVVRHVIEHAYGQLERGEEHYVGAHVSDDALALLGLPNLPRAPEPLMDAPAADAAASAPASTPASTPATGAAAAVDELAAPPPSAPPPEGDSLEVALDNAFSARISPTQPPELHTPAVDARVLVAHADPELRSLLAAQLVEHGIACVEAEDGVQALELVRSAQPRLCVLGPSLPSVHGLDICRRLRASARYAHLPLLLVTEGAVGWRFAHDAREGLGIAHVFGKPYAREAIIQAIRLLLEGQPVPEEPPPLSPEAEACWSTGMDAFSRGDLAVAIAELERGRAIDPDAFELLYHLGLLYGRRDDLFTSMRMLEQAVAQQPRHFAAIKNLAVVYQRAEMRQSAIDAWQRATTCAPDDATSDTIKQHLLKLL